MGMDAYQKAAAIMTENMPHISRSGVEVKRETCAMLERIVSAGQHTCVRIRCCML